MNEQNDNSLAKLDLITQEQENKARPRFYEFGLCATCSHVDIASTEYSVVRARCIFLNSHPVNISMKEPVARCTSYEKYGSMNMWDMNQIATEIHPKKNEARFK